MLIFTPESNFTQYFKIIFLIIEASQNLFEAAVVIPGLFVIIKYWKTKLMSGNMK